MKDSERIKNLEVLLTELIYLLNSCEETLRSWATESVTGGWSTHQVVPQRELADRIACTLFRVNRIRKTAE